MVKAFVVLASLVSYTYVRIISTTYSNYSEIVIGNYFAVQ